MASDLVITPANEGSVSIRPVEPDGYGSRTFVGADNLGEQVASELGNLYLERPRTGAQSTCPAEGRGSLVEEHLHMGALHRPGYEVQITISIKIAAVDRVEVFSRLDRPARPHGSV